jgi:8-oxo-dGTP pyrophosphatase MutT (NUDIX family)
MQEKTMYGSGEVTLTFLDVAAAVERISNVTTVHCFPIKNGEVLFTVNPRGIDIIGGHVEKGETYYQALMREAKEEASIFPMDYKIIGAIEVDNTNNPKALEMGYPLKGVQLFFSVTEFKTEPFVATHECTDRMYLKPEDVATKHHKWLNIHQHLLEEALKIQKEPTKKVKP